MAPAQGKAGMRLLSLLVSGALLLAAQPGFAQSAQSKDSIVVTGTVGPDGKPIPMSDWRVAETDHLLVYSKGDEKKLVRVAHNLEKLHFLLSMLLNRVDEPDPTIKLRVTLIGDAADFDQLKLRNLRWQTGPIPAPFPTSAITIRATTARWWPPRKSTRRSWSSRASIFR